MAKPSSFGGHLADIGGGLGSGLGGLVGGIGSGVGGAIGGIGGGITSTIGGVTNQSPWMLLVLGGAAYLLFAKPSVPMQANATPLAATHPLPRQLQSTAS